MSDDELKKKAAEMMSNFASQKKRADDANDSFEETMRQLQNQVPSLLGEWEAVLRKCIDAMNEAATAQGLHDKFVLMISRPPKGNSSGGMMGFRFGDFDFILTYTFAGSPFGFDVCSTIVSQLKLRGNDIADRVKARYRLMPKLQSGKAILTVSVSGEDVLVEPNAFWTKEIQRVLQNSM